MKKRALIIGGSSGIGLATAKKLADSGFDLVIIYRERRAQAATVEESFDQFRSKETSIDSYNIDGTNEEKIQEVIQDITQKHGENSFDLFLHSLSRGNLKSILPSSHGELEAGDFQLTIDAMGLNFIFWVKGIFKQSLFRKGARVLALTSEGNDKYWPGYDAIAIAKSTLETAVKYLAVEMAPHDIRVNCIQAGVTVTPSLKLIPGSDTLIKESEKRNPFGKLTTPEDVANVIYLLSREEAQWINGSLIHVDGGEHLL